MLVKISLVAGSLALVYFGGTCLIRGAASLASQIGVSPLAIGLTVVAFGTSAPELVVSVNAALSGANDIAVGNIVGSNTANIALILGLSAVIRPLAVEAKIVRIDSPVMILVSIALAIALFDGQASRLEGILLLACLAAYTAFTFWESRRETQRVQTVFASAAPGLRAGILSSSLLVVAGLALLVGGGQLLVDSAVDLAILLGVSQAAIGLTVVAIGTSLPELSASVIATFRGHGDIAIGNVVGSNIFNVLGILGITAVIHPLEMGGITWIDLGVMISLACIVAVFLYTRLRLDRIEGGFLVAGFVLYTSWLFAA